VRPDPELCERSHRIQNKPFLIYTAGKATCRYYSRRRKGWAYFKQYNDAHPFFEVDPGLAVNFKAYPEIRLVEAPEATFLMPKLRHLSNQLLVSINIHEKINYEKFCQKIVRIQVHGPLRAIQHSQH
jgi:hypothetical protein